MKRFQSQERADFDELVRLRVDASKAVERVTDHLFAKYPDGQFEHDDLNVIRTNLMQTEAMIGSQLRNMKILYRFADQA